jgi:MarR family transcriptional regulator, organic hydroperoxide resistance regulator
MHIENCISFLLGKAGQQIARRFRERLAPFGVTPPQYAVLSVLWELDGQSGAELCTRLVLDSATITGLVDRLEMLKLAGRRADEVDRRVNRVFLTESAQALKKPMGKAIRALNQEIAAELGESAPLLWQTLRQLSAGRT